ncbi:MAG: zinc-binding dehydrogenase [Candidatus Hadarchaeales archaeon]
MARAAVATGVGVIEIKDFEAPKAGEGCLLIRIKACGVCGTDVHIFRGHRKVPFPLILGHEFSGVVEEIGEKASSRLHISGGELKVGEKVTVVPGVPCGRCYYCKNFPESPNLCQNRLIYGGNRPATAPPYFYGGFAEYIYVEPGAWVYKLPKEMPVEIGALAEPAAVSTRALSRATGVLGKASKATVVVQGLGAIGLLAVAAAKVSGAKMVIGVDQVDQRLEMAQKMGADEVIDMKECQTSEERVKRVMELTEGIGSDITIECAGVPAAFREGIEFTRRGGKYVEVGHFADPGGVEIRPHQICFRDMDVLGSWVYPMWQFSDSLKLLASGRFPFEEMFTHRFKVEETQQAIETAARGECIKALVTP